MIFKIDEQTYKDLQIFGTKDSIECLFNRTKTAGGSTLIHQLMRSPTFDEKELQLRSSAIKFFSERHSLMDFNKRCLDDIEYYSSMIYPTFKKNALSHFVTSVRYFFKPSSEIYNILTGIDGMISVLRSLHKELNRISLDVCPPFLKNQFTEALKILSDNEFKCLINEPGNGKFFLKTLKFDSLLRFDRKNEIRFLIELVYKIDAYVTVAGVVNKKNLSFPEFLTDEKHVGILSIEGLFHLSLANPIGNDVTLDGKTSLCLISGPNMAGKSTFLRALGVSVYLAHIGFAVPAKQMKTSLFYGLSTTINLTDDMVRGYSHFYSELMRIKEVINYIQEYKRFVVIFDELFRGTNVKDAFDGTVLLSRHFAELSRCKIFISTHIVEVIEKLSDGGSSCLRKYFDAKVSNGIIEYDYILKDGVSTQRLGALLIKNEAILERLAEIVRTERD